VLCLVIRSWCNPPVEKVSGNHPMSKLLNCFVYIICD
jgi:hypothetical protein